MKLFFILAALFICSSCDEFAHKTLLKLDPFKSIKTNEGKNKRESLAPEKTKILPVSLEKWSDVVNKHIDKKYDSDVYEQFMKLRVRGKGNNKYQDLMFLRFTIFESNGEINQLYVKVKTRNSKNTNTSNTLLNSLPESFLIDIDKEQVRDHYHSLENADEIGVITRLENEVYVLKDPNLLKAPTMYDFKRRPYGMALRKKVFTYADDIFIIQTYAPRALDSLPEFAIEKKAQAKNLDLRIFGHDLYQYIL